MTIAHLIDTDWVIHHLNGHAAIQQRLQDLQPEGLGLSVVALAEVYEGVFYSRNPAQSERGLNDFLQSVTIVGIDEATTKIFGRERGRLRAAGMLIGDMEICLILSDFGVHSFRPPMEEAMSRLWSQLR